jgi:type I restriction enzyme S subunit
MTQIFAVDSLENRTGRIDSHYFDPRYYATIEKLKTLSEKSRFKITPLGSLLDENSKTKLTGGATPRGAVYVSEGVKFIRVQNVQPNRLESKNLVFINYATHENLLKRSRLKPNDIILTITGTYGVACVVPKDIGDANINQHCVKIEVDQTKIEPYYLSCFLNSDLCKRQMDRAVTGSSRPALDYPAIKELLIVHSQDAEERQKEVRPIQEMETEAYDKINMANELLDKERDVLLELLKIRFPLKSSKASFEIELDTLSDRIDAIYHNPSYNELIKSLKKGTYPCEPLHKLAKIDTKRINPHDFPDTTYKHVELDNIDGDLGVITMNREVFGIELPKGSKTAFHTGQILLSRLRYYLRKIALVPQGFDNGLGSPEFHTLSCFEDVEPFFLVSVLRHEIVIDQTEHEATGSSRPRLTKNDISSILVPRPPIDVQESIAKRIMDLHSQVIRLREEGRLLLTTARQRLEKHLYAER